MDVGFQTLADHANGIADALLGVDQKFVREDVENLAVFGKRNVAGSVDGTAHVIAFDVTRAMAERDPTTAVHTANVATCDADERGFNRHIGHAFGFFHRAPNGANRGIEIYDQSLAQAL